MPPQGWLLPLRKTHCTVPVKPHDAVSLMRAPDTTEVWGLEEGRMPARCSLRPNTTAAGSFGKTWPPNAEAPAEAG